MREACGTEVRERWREASPSWGLTPLTLGQSPFRLWERGGREHVGDERARDVGGESTWERRYVGRGWYRTYRYDMVPYRKFKQ